MGYLTIENSNALRPLDSSIPCLDPPSHVLAAISASHEWANTALSRPNSVSTALLVSSSTKLFPILMVIWEYDVPAAARSLGWAVVANNVEALKIFLIAGTEQRLF